MGEYPKKCGLCVFKKDIEASDNVMCKYKGIVSKEHICKKFQFDYLILNPKRRKVPDFTGFSAEDFSI